MWDEFVAGFVAMPTWAQIAVSLFAVMVVVMLFEPGVTRRKYAASLKALAAAAGATTHRVDQFTEWFTMEVNGRPFEVRRELRSRSRGGSYRGPTGHLLVTSTPLAGSRWSVHQLTIAPGRVPAWLGGPPRLTGDAAFDGRFMVTQDGVPVREGWLDQPTRAAVTAFFDQPAATGPVWVQEQHLQHLADASWSRLDLPALKGLLTDQAALATALERTGGWRGPAA